jgi:hypothetical protein
MLQSNEPEQYIAELTPINDDTKRQYYLLLFSLEPSEIRELNVDPNNVTDSDLHETEELIKEKYPSEEDLIEDGKEKLLPVLRFYRELMLMESSSVVFNYNIFKKKGFGNADIDYTELTFRQRLDQLRMHMANQHSVFSVEDIQEFIDQSIRPLLFGWYKFSGQDHTQENIFEDDYHCAQGYLNRKSSI